MPSTALWTTGEFAMSSTVRSGITLSLRAPSSAFSRAGLCPKASLNSSSVENASTSTRPCNSFAAPPASPSSFLRELSSSLVPACSLSATGDESLCSHCCPVPEATVARSIGFCALQHVRIQNATSTHSVRQTRNDAPVPSPARLPPSASAR
eukprot:SAG31_NODE_9494_length_1268_cov_1.265184_2_plen_152_part_00